MIIKHAIPKVLQNHAGEQSAIENILNFMRFLGKEFLHQKMTILEKNMGFI